MSERRIIFLDIDGVLNNHEYSKAAQSCLMKRECVEYFNEILEVTDARYVVTSSWRYMVHGGAMSLHGFEYLLRTHGVMADRMEGLTVDDETVERRAEQVSRWFRDNPGVSRYVVLDDGDFGFREFRYPFVQTNGNVGLTADNRDEAIAVLTET